MLLYFATASGTQSQDISGGFGRLIHHGFLIHSLKITNVADILILAGGLEHCLFSPIGGMMIQSD